MARRSPSSQDKPRGRLQAWLAPRLGSHGAAAAGAPGWSRVLGMMLVALLALEIVTGVAMAFVYSPSTTDAWASIAWLEHEVRLGSFVRALHHWGNDALVTVALLHLVTSFVIGAYRKPRELTWLFGLATLLIILGFTLTGNVLAFDAYGLASSRVETQIMASMPLIGPLQRELLIGGNDYGNLSLTRFYALHALVLPAVLLGLVGAHVALARRHGPAPRWWHSPQDEATRRVAYWPSQAARDAVGAALVVGVVAVLAFVERAPLYAPADPASAFDARPAWYLMPLFELRKTFTGSGELVATMLLPGLALAFLAVVPFLDRGDSPSPVRRWRFVAPMLFGVVIAVVLGAMGLVADRNNEAHQKALRDAAAQADEALRLSRLGGVPLDPLRLVENDPVAWGAELFAEHCTSCHGVGSGQGSAPDLGGWGSRAWLARFLRDPNHPHVYGGTALGCKMFGVDTYGVDVEADLGALVDGLLRNRGEHAPADLPADAGGRLLEVFDDAGCQACHRLEVGDEVLGRVESVGPDLSRYGSAQWLETLLLFPDAATHYGALNAMPSFAGTLDRAEREALQAYVMTLDAQPLSPEPSAEALAAADCASPSGAAPKDATPTTPATASANEAIGADASWRAGQQLFAARCASCHAIGGVGNDVGPDLAGWGSRAWLLAFLENPDHPALYGGTDLEGAMPPAEALGLEEPEELDLVVSAILARRGGHAPALEAALAPGAQEIFEEYSCGNCHELELAGQVMGSLEGSGPRLTGWGSPVWLHGLLADPGAEAYYGDDNAMPPFTDLSPEQLADLTRYMMSLSEVAR